MLKFLPGIFVVFIMMTLAISCTAPNKLSESQKKDGWELIFDGKSTSGWHSYGGKPAGSAWKVADGALYLDTSSRVKGNIVGGGNLVSEGEYEDFHLKLEWKIAPKGNSGIMFFVQEDPANFSEPYMTGPEMQVLDNDGHPDGKYTKHRAGDLYDLLSCSKETVKPVGEWNLAEIKCEKGKLDMYLNGTNVVSTTMWDDAWNKMVEGSKFKGWKGFGAYKKGKISLQDHGDKVSYRNIMIRRL